MANKNSKREILEKIAKQEASRHLINKDVEIFNCGHNFCPFVLPAESLLYGSSAIQNSPEFAQALEDIKENYSRDHLSVGDRIISDFFEHEGINDEYDLGEIDPLGDGGFHITDDPGFGRS